MVHIHLHQFHQCNLTQHWTQLYSLRCQIVYKLNRACGSFMGPSTHVSAVDRTKKKKQHPLRWSTFELHETSRWTPVILITSPKPHTDTIHWSETIQKNVKVYQMKFTTRKYITSLSAHSDVQKAAQFGGSSYEERWTAIPIGIFPSIICLTGQFAARTHNHTFVIVRTINAIITILLPHRLIFFQNRSVLNKVSCLHWRNLVLWMVV